MGREKKKISLSVSTLNELCFWKENIPFLNSRRLLSTQFHYSCVCYSDASSTGCASYMLDLHNTISHKLWNVKAAASRTFVVLLCEKFWLSAFNSRADNTVINYCKSFCKFKAWCLHSTGVVSFLPATSFTVSLYLHHLLENSLGSSTIYGVFYAINWVHKLSVFENPNPCDNFLVRPIVEASSRAPHPSKFSNHSFRSRGATSAANQSVLERHFKVHGRWKSDSAKDGYVRDKVDSRLYVPLHIGI
ncbi:unnamed protein product [Porites lobata]|uniref:Maturase K n=1 Tax=Porites lobata TaxID=104759 RepID=A0ABN8QWS1_9CNID|nr:unnamed protein product [Porites lobata]